MKIFVFGNGNLSFDDFVRLYKMPLSILIERDNPTFLLSDFRGVDTMMMEFLKTITPNVVVYHMGTTPRYFPDKFKTKAGEWSVAGQFNSDKERDSAAIKSCTHFLAYDFNSDQQRKSGTLKNIESCLALHKVDLRDAHA
jgi:hypothetical protein